MRLTAVLLALLALPVFAEEKTLYDDPRVAEWSKAFLEGRRDAAIAAVEKDLRSDAPHPLAALVWVELKGGGEGLKATWSGIEDARLRKAAEIAVLMKAERYAELCDRFDTDVDIMSLTYLGWAAYNTGRYDRALALSLEGLRRRPDRFQEVWNIYDIAKQSEPHRAKVLAALDADATLGARTVKQLLKYRSPGDLDKIRIADTFLAERPNDVRALRFRAVSLHAMRKHEEAAATYERITRIFPFRNGLSWKRHARALIALERYDEARAVVTRAAKLLGKDADEWFAVALVAESHLGKAREVLDAAREKRPDDIGLRAPYAELEMKSRRYVHAVPHARAVAQAKPDDRNAQRNYINALRRTSGSLETARREWERAEKRLVYANTSFYYSGVEIMLDLDRPEEAAAIARRAAKAHPQNAWPIYTLARALGRAGENGEARAAMVRSYDISPPSTWDIGLLRGFGECDDILAAQRRKYPWCEALWKDLAAQKDGLDGKIAVWREAARKNPGRTWAHLRLNELYVFNGRFKEALAACRAAGAIEGLPPGDQADAVLYELWTLRRMIQSRRATAAHVHHGLKLVDRYLELGAHEVNAQSYRAKYLSALGRRKEAGAAYMRLAELDPSVSNVMGNLFQSDAEIGPRKWVHVQRCVARDPFDGDRLSSAGERHLQWGGGTISALQYFELLKERAPDVYRANRYRVAKAYGFLGDHARHYRDEYAQTTRISPSVRYVNWYDSTRREAQGQSARVTLDIASGTATIVHADGRVERRREHPVTGRLTYWQIGAAHVAVEYHPVHLNLSAIRTSAGEWITLEYNDGEQISKLATSAGETLTFAHNEAGKVSRIEVTGVGVMNISYDAKGEVDKIESPEGHKMALNVQRAMQKLLGLTRLVNRGFRGQLPELPHKDEARDKLNADMQEKLARMRATPDDLALRHAAAAAVLALADHLVTHLKDRKDYANDATQLVRGLITMHERAPDDTVLRGTAVRAAMLWHKLLRVQREAGLTRGEWLVWDALVRRMEQLPRDEFLTRFFETTRKEPLQLLEAARWLPRSSFVNRGFWRRYAHRQVVPRKLEKRADLRCAVVRGNGDVVVGTGAGLAVLRQGYWEWFGFDDKRGRFSAAVEPGDVTASSEVLAVAESGDGTLWVGTATGLVALDDGYTGAPHRWRTAEDGLPTPRVEHLSALKGAVLIGTAKGLLRVTDGKMTPVADFPVRFAKGAVPLFHGLNEVALVGAPDGLFACGATGDARKLADGAVDDAVWMPWASRLLVLTPGPVKVHAHAWDGKTAPSERRALRGQSDIVFSRAVAGLALLPVSENEAGVAVLTDQGLSIHHDEHFEHLPLPLADRTPGVERLVSRDGRTYLLTTDGVYAYERAQVMGDARGRVHDIVSCDDLGKTFVARDYKLEVVDHANPRDGAQLLDRLPARCLTRDAGGALLVAAGTRVVRYANGQRPGQVVFEAKQTLPKRHRAGNIRSLLVASDGSIWAVAGASVFRFKDGTTDEFSIYKDVARFPARCDMIANVVETKDNEILVIASNEAHRNFRGQALSGGVLRFTGDRFEMTSLKRNPHWFVTSYTKVGPDEAIVGTAQGFARHRGDRYASFETLKDTSYSHLTGRTPQLFLGTRGAKLGKDVWLFGTGGGVVGWRAGQWFYPDRLNWMLPAPHLALYGARHVHAVATDAAGRVYAGTDRGLLIYDSGGGDAVSFLVSNDLRTAAFVSLESDKLQREADILLSSLKPGGAMARKVKRYRKSLAEITRLKQVLATGGTALGKVRDTGAKPDGKQAAVVPEAGGREKLEKLLASRERTHRALLSRLERENLGLFQMLELKPLDLAAVRKKLAANQAVVQYLPTPQKLFIHVVKRDSIEVREVNVASKELFARAHRAARMLEVGGRGLKRDKDDLRDPKAELRWLYDHLLRPVEHELDGLTHVFVVPSGQLTYVPFAGLMRTEKEYAVERFTFGVLPSMYLLHLALSQTPSTATDALVLGDPDGSLPGARKEARTVHELLAGGIDVQIGDEANYENLCANAEDARIVHFATHGVLDHKKPEQSYLLLAGGYRLGVLDIQELPLKEADLVVLSACQTGIGREGMEFATIARAFAHAGVPTTVATLWRVDDAATRTLIETFYGHLTDGDDIFVALAKAQRAMLGAGGKHAEPSMWSGFLPFGRP